MKIIVNNTNETNFIGDRIRECRIASGLTIKELSDISGIGKQTIWDYEKRNDWSSIKCIERLANALDVSPTYLTGWNDDPLSPSHLTQDNKVKLTDNEKMVLDAYRHLTKDQIKLIHKMLEIE